MPIVEQIDAVLRLKPVRYTLNDQGVEVVASQTGVAVRGAHLDDTLAQLYDRNVEGAPTKVVDGDVLIVFAIQSIREGSRGWLVDDARDFKASDLAGVPGRLSGRVGEVGRDCDDRLLDRLVQVFLRDMPESGEDES